MGVLSNVKKIVKTVAKKLTGSSSSGSGTLSTNISNQSKYVAPPTYSKQKAEVNKIVDVMGQLQKDVANAKAGVGQSSANNLKRPAPLKPYDIPTVPDGPMSKLPIGTTTTPTTTKSKSSGGGSSSKSSLQSVQNLAASDGAMSFSAPASSSSLSSSSGGSSGGTSSSGSKLGSASSGGGGAGGVNSGSTPAQQLEEARQAALRIQSEVQKLAEKEKTAATDAIVSDSEITKEEEAAQKALKDAQKVDDSSLKLLKAEMRQAKADALAEMESINGAYNTQKTGMEGKQLNETGQTAVGIANAGGFLGFSGSGTGVMLKLAESHRAELASLESQRQNALTTARKAAAERRFDIVQEQVSEIARIDNEKYNRVQEYNNKVIENAEKEKAKAEELQTQQDVFNAIQGGAKTVQDIYKKLGGNTSIKDISTYLEALSPSSSKTGFKFSANETAGLLGAGMSQDDIAALQEYVNENGYTETVRNNLTPAQRAVADEIYGRKTGTSSGTVFVTPEGVSISDTTMQVLDGFTSLKSLTPTAKAKVQSELYALGFNSDKVPKWFDETAVTELLGVPLTQQALEDFYKVNMEPTRLAEAMAYYKNKFITDTWKNYRARVTADTTGSSSGGSASGLSSINEGDI